MTNMAVVQRNLPLVCVILLGVVVYCTLYGCRRENFVASQPGSAPESQGNEGHFAENCDCKACWHHEHDHELSGGNHPCSCSRCAAKRVQSLLPQGDEPQPNME